MTITIGVYRKIGKNTAGDPITDASFTELIHQKHQPSSAPLSATPEPGFPYIYTMSLQFDHDDVEVSAPGFYNDKLTSVVDWDSLEALLEPYPAQ